LAPLASTAPATISATWPYTLSGSAGNARGVARVEVELNGGAPVNATLGTASSSGSVSYSLPMNPSPGANTAIITVVDLRGNETSLTVTFTFARRHALAILRTAPSGIALDDAGTVTFAASPSSQASTLTPTTPNASPRTSNVQEGTSVTLTATPRSNYAFVSWSGLPTGATVTGNVASFNMPTNPLNVTANFATSASVFAGASGSGNTFSGLIRPQTGTATSNATAGFLTGTLTASNGVFSGRILVDGVNQAFSATFYGNGSSVFNTVPRSNTLSFSGRTLSLSLNTTGDRDEITATLVTSAGSSSGVAKRAIYSSTNTFANAGTYTVVLPSKTQSPAKTLSTYPQGDGFTTLTITNTGTVTLIGTLADDTAVTATSHLVEGDEIPFLVQMFTPGSTTVRGGSFSGNLEIDTTQADSDLSGVNLLWIRPSVTEGSTVATRLYTNGWPSGITLDAVGALYDKTVSLQTSLGLSTPNTTLGNGNLTFTDGKLASAITITNFNISGNTITRIPSTTKTFSLSASASNGQFSGTFTPNWTNKATALPTFKGIILQKGANKAGYGFFLSNRASDNDPESGGVTLSKRP
jgi:hypothetical protein